MTCARRVDFRQNEDDMTVAVMGSLGFSTQFIMEKTGLTQCQVSYRLSKAEIKRASFRNGDNWAAKSVLQQMNHGVRTRIAPSLPRV